MKLVYVQTIRCSGVAFLHILWSLSSHVKICMLMEFDTACCFCHGVTNIRVRGDGLCFDLVGGAPFKQCEIANIDMSSSFGWSSCVNHEDSTSIVDKKLGGAILNESEIIQ